MKLLIFCLLAAAGGYFLPFQAVDAASKVLAPAIALMATGIFPSMTLVVGSMKAEERTPQLIEELHANLKRLLSSLVAAFVLAVASLTLIVSTGAAIATKEPMYVQPWAIRTLVVLCAITITLLAGRAVAVARTFFAILEVNRKQALLTARAKNRTSWQSARDKAKFDLPEGYAENAGPLTQKH